ncbi:hypothetical protein D3C85_91240 [compost metagenome]
MDSSGRRFVPFDKFTSRAELNDPDLKGRENAAFTMRYVNASSRSISVKTRMGVHSIIKPKQYTQGGEYIDVFLEWTMTKESYKSTYVDFLDRHRNPQGLAAEIITAFEARLNSWSHAGKLTTLTIHVEIQLNDVVNAGGSVYLEELDLLISLEPEAEKFEEHPFSNFNRLQYGLAADLPHLGKDTLLFSIKAVDNSSLRNRHDRFILLGNAVHHIPIERDLRLRDGVHVTTRRPAAVKNVVGSGATIHTEHLSFEDADARYNLADSIEKAQAGVSWQEMRKEEIARRAHEQKMKEFDRTAEKADTDHTYTREKTESERAFAREREEWLRWKHREDDVKEKTKNLGDWIRLVGGIITSSLTVLTMVAKMKPS